MCPPLLSFFFFFNDTATTEIYTLSLHDALPISTRDLLRRRLHLVRKRGQLLAHIQNTRAQYNLPEFKRRLAYPANRDGVPEQFADPSVRKSVDVDLVLIDQYDRLINDLEMTLVRDAKRHDADAFHRLRSVPG